MDEATSIVVPQCNCQPNSQTVDDSILLLEKRSFRPFKSSEEYLYAMKEDLAEWLNSFYVLDIDVDNFFDKLENGVVLCKHANNIRKSADEHRKENTKNIKVTTNCRDIPPYEVYYRSDAAAGSFFARDNVHNFIRWCRDLGVHEVLMFETDDLVLRKNEKHVILALLEIARRGVRFGMQAPILVQMEVDIDKELEADRLAEETRLLYEGQDMLTYWEESNKCVIRDIPLLIYGPQPQIITNDLKSLDEMVRELVERCTCPSQFPMIKVSEGKYRIGDTKVLIFVRILRNHVMVRVGGGWDTLHHYLDKHDPCRCRFGHRFSNLSKVGYKNLSSGDRQLSSVTYDRPQDNLHPASPLSRRKNGHWRKEPVIDRYSQPLRSQSHVKTTFPPSLHKETNHKHDVQDVIPSSPDVWCDSSSEVSDEGYKSQGPPRSSARPKKPQHNLGIEEITERPDSSMTQLSEDSCISGGEDAIAKVDKIAEHTISSFNKEPNSENSQQNPKSFYTDNSNSRLLLPKKIKKNSSPDNCHPAWNSGPGKKLDPNNRARRSSSSEPLENRTISRSQSATSEGGFQYMLNRETPNRQSYRTSPKKSLPLGCGNNTWNSRNNTQYYPGLKTENLKSPMINRSIRSASASPMACRRRFPNSGTPTPITRSHKRSAPASVLSSPGSIVPNDFINKFPSVGSEGDIKILAQLENLLNCYRVRVANHLAAEKVTSPHAIMSEPAQNIDTAEKMQHASLKMTPRKSGVGSRIPAPTFFKPPQTEI